MIRLFGFVLSALFALPAAAGEELYVYNWSEYMPHAVIEQFEQESGIKVSYATFDSNEAMYAKLKVVASGEGYDIAVPSTYYVAKMGREGLLLPIDRSRLTNWGNLDAKLLGRPYDPDNRYSIPYLWGTTGIAVDGNRIDPATVTSWADLWNPEYKGKLLLTNDPREVFDIGLKVLGHSANSTDPKEIEAAYQRLTTLLPNVRLFNSDSPKEPFLMGEVSIGMIWNGEAYQARQENPKLAYIYPKEGAIVWTDSLVIPKNARNVEGAHRFIDFILRPEIAKQISEEIGYAPPNKAALALLDEGVRNDRVVYPNDEDLAGAEFQNDVGEAILVYERFWERLKVTQ